MTFALAQKQGTYYPFALFYHNQVVIFLFYPQKTKQKQVGAKVGRSHAPPNGDGCSVAIHSTSSSTRNALAFFTSFTCLQCFWLYMRGPDFQIWYSRRSQRVILMLLFFRDISRVHVPCCKKGIYRLTIYSFHFEAQTTFWFVQVAIIANDVQLFMQFHRVPSSDNRYIVSD